MGDVKNEGLYFLNFFFVKKSLYNNGSIGDVDLRLIFYRKFFFNWYCDSNLCLLFLFKVFFVFCSKIIFFFLVKKVFDVCLFLYMIFWYVIRIFVLGIGGLIICFLYFVKVKKEFKLNFKKFIILFIINICGFFGL